ncbi:ChbG/HpnK family deacetylase [Aquirhabdus sp.]|uniref:ChbG/HpnK family deacetylase n=1 Tax=Aquirhabdus sp. TaxID=2824160 RepID=UPI00396CE9B9
MANIVFCADDYALNTPISQAIVNLITHDRLQATSCMTQAPDWSIHGTTLRELQLSKPQAQIGLHFNLTHDFSDGMLFLPLGQLMQKAWLRTLSRSQVEQTLIYQWQRFIDIMGRAPDFVDGHQHVHQFPVIRDVLMNFLVAQNFTGWIRSLSDAVITPRFWFKSKMLQFLGAQALTRLSETVSIPQNQKFAGIYDFSETTPYSTLAQFWLDHANSTKPIQIPTRKSRIDPSLLIMCHPAVDASDLSDSIAAARVREYQYLSSDQFLKDCIDRHITLAATPSGAL